MTTGEPRGRKGRQRQLAQAMLELLGRSKDAVPNPYVSRHLSGYVADGDAWHLLAEQPHILDRLDPLAVTSDALRTFVGTSQIPATIAGVIAARGALEAANLRDRAGIRQVATARYGRQERLDEPAETVKPWSVPYAYLAHRSLSLLLRGHAGYVNSICAFAGPDREDLAASAGNDGTIRIWDPRSGVPIGGPLLGHKGTVETVCAIPSRRGYDFLASGGSDGIVRVWNPTSGLPFADGFAGHEGIVWSVCSVAIDGGQSVIVSGGADGTVRAWNVDTQKEFSPPLLAHVGSVECVCPVVGSIVASAGRDGNIRTWDMSTGRLALDFSSGHVGPIWSIASFVSPDGEAVIVSAGDDGTLRMFSALDGRALVEAGRGHIGTVEWVTSFQDPFGLRYIATAGGDGTLRFWDTRLTQVGPPLIGHSGQVWSVAAIEFMKEHYCLLSAGSDGDVRLWPAGPEQVPAQQVETQAGTVEAMCAVRVEERDVVAAGYGDGRIRWWDVETLMPIHEAIHAHEGQIWTLFSVELKLGPAIASGGADGCVCVWDVGTKALLAGPLQMGGASITAICDIRLGDGSHALVCAGSDGSVELWDVAGGEYRGPLTLEHEGPVASLCVVRQGRQEWLVTGGTDGTLRVWSPEHEATIATLRGHVGPVTHVCPVPGEERLRVASSGSDGTVRLWSVEDPFGPILDPIAGHGGGVWKLATWASVKDGDAMVASAGSDGTVRVWSARTGEAVGEAMTGHRGGVYGLCASGVGRDPWIASGGSDGTVRVWRPGRKGQIGETLRVSRLRVRALDLCDIPAGGSRALFAQGNQLWSWNDRTIDPMTLSTIPGGEITCISSLSAEENSDLVVCGASDGSISVIASETGLITQHLDLGRGPVLACAAISSADWTAAVATADCTVSLLSLARGEHRPNVSTLHRAPVRALAALHSADSSLLVTGDQSGGLHLYRVTEEELILETSFQGHGDWIHDICPIRELEGVRFATVSGDGTLATWERRSTIPVATRRISAARLGAVCSVALNDWGTGLLVGGEQGLDLWDLALESKIYSFPLDASVSQLAEMQQEVSEVSDEVARILVGTTEGVLTMNLGRGVFESLTLDPT